MFPTTPKSEKLTVHLARPTEFDLLQFLWRWKVSTTAALSHRFYANRTPHRAYQRLWKLERAGFIKTRADESAKVHLWTLDKRGFAVVRSRIHHLKEDGFISENREHDLLVTAAHLGDALLKPNCGLEFFTEQELRRIDPAFFPKWVPQSQSRRPDGYWRVITEGSPKVIALEVELSPKQESEYESIGRFYDDHSEIDQVLWVVKEPNLIDTIHQIARSVSRRPFKHSFVLLDPICSLGWLARISSGSDQGKTMNELLRNTTEKAAAHVSPQFLLDTRKTPHRSKCYEHFQTPSFSY